MNNLLNNKGITLVELLAALALIGIIATVAGSLVTQTYQSNSKVQNEIDLKQQTNSILTIIREQITEENMEICLVDRHTLRLDDDGESPFLYPNLITKEQMTISELYIENTKNSSPSTLDKIDLDQNSTSNDVQCIETDNNPTSLNITTTTSSEVSSNPQSYTVSTIIQKRENNYSITIPQDDTEGDSQDSKIFTTSEEFNSIEADRESDFTRNHPNGDENRCEFDDNILLNSNQVFAPTWGYKCKTTTFNQSLWSKTNLTLNSSYNSPVTVLVKENFYLDQGANLYKDSVLDIDGNGLFRKGVVLGSESSLNVMNGYFMGGIILQNQSLLRTQGSIRVDESSTLQSSSEMTVQGYGFMKGQFTLQTNALLDIGRDLNAQQLFLQSNSEVNVDGNTFVDESLNLQRESSLSSQGNISVGEVELQSTASLFTGGTLLINDKLHIQNNALLIANKGIVIKGETTMQSDAMIFSEGNITFQGKVETQNNNIISSQGDITFNRKVGPDWSNATICAEGNIFGIENIEPNHNILSNQQPGSCPTP